jgi:hypothetical protein
MNGLRLAVSKRIGDDVFNRGPEQLRVADHYDNRVAFERDVP